MPIDLDTAIFNPASVFKKPEEILEDQKIILSKEQKMRALTTWRYDLQLRRMAEEENMHSNQDVDDAALEQKILDALKTLENPV